MKAKFYCLAVLLLLQSVVAQAGAIRNLPGFLTTVYGGNDDGTYPATGSGSGIPPGTPVAVPIGFSINFYGRTFTNLYVNNNGNVTFDVPLGNFTPFGLVHTASEIIAAFFADVDTRTGNLVTFGNDTVDGHQAFGVNWISVGYYSQKTDKLNSFQLILINRSDRNPGDFDIEFNYDMVQWETGDASGGSDGVGGSPAVVGFSNGSGLPGTSFQFDGSGISRSFLDINPGGLTHGSLNTNTLGRYIIPIVNLTNTILNVPYFSQGDSRWGTNAYDSSGTNIQAQGCAVSCLAMALKYAGISTDPGQLNTLLVNSNDFDGNGVNWGPATRDASHFTLEFHAHRSTDSQYLSQILSAGFPVIVRVTTAQGGSHFVLVIGAQNGHFLINDPGHANATTLDFYNNDFETRGYVSDPPGDISEFDLSTGNGTELLVVDPLGRRTGYDPASGLVVQEISQSVHFSDTIEKSDLTGAPGTNTAHLVDIYQPLQGDYQIFLLSTGPDNYKLLLRSFSQSGTPGAPLTLQGSRTTAGITAFQVHLGPSGVTSEPFTNECVWSVSPTNGYVPLNVQFTGPSTDSLGNSITNWYWIFGDGLTGTDQSPSKTYTNSGTLFPGLIAVNNNGATVVSYGPSIFIPAVPFTASPTNGAAPLTVQFTSGATDTGGNTITGWSWDFGDGSTSILQSPSHAYTNSGTFLPTLTCMNNQAATVYGTGPSITVLSVGIANGGFETGDFTGWTLVDSSLDTFVDTGSFSGIAPHSGTYLAALAPIETLGTLSEDLATIPGQYYSLSLWLNSDGLTPNEFHVIWNGHPVFDQLDVPASGWTNLQFTVRATGPSTVVQFAFRDDPGYLGLDDVSVVPISVSVPPVAIARSGTNVLVTWPTNANGIAFTLQSSTNMAPSAAWNTIFTSPVTINGKNTVTNPISGKQMFFRLSE
jgi:PKD repeat protein